MSAVTETPSLARRIKLGIKTLLPRAVLEQWYIAQFLLRQRFGQLQIPDAPEFDAPGQQYFSARLLSAKAYLEYGSGGSTVLAAKARVPFTTIDSDRFFLRSLQAKIAEELKTDGGRYIYCDIGLTKMWGTPIFTRPSAKRRSRWRNYAEAPWQADGRDFLPDLVLIDGRFRVVCALASIKHLSNKIDFEILVDDYASRPELNQIEKFAELRAMCGRMAVFKPKPTIDHAALDRAIDRYTVDYR